MNLMIQQRREKLRNLILDVLRHTDRATAREIAYELQVHDVSKSPMEITSIINGDPQLKAWVEINWQDYGGWQRMTFTLRRNYNQMTSSNERG